MPISLRAIVFDVDGTLYEAGPVRRKMITRLAREILRNPISGWELASFIRAFRRAQEDLRGAPQKINLREEQLRIACVRANLPRSEAQKLLDVWFEETPLNAVAQYVRPGLHQFLTMAAQRGMRLGVLSDYPASKKLEAIGISKYFHSVLHSQQPEINEFKPSPKGLLITLKALGVTPDQALYIGDRPDIDAVAALRAGVSAVIVGMPLRKSGDGWIGVPSFTELQRLILLRT